MMLCGYCDLPMVETITRSGDEISQCRNCISDVFNKYIQNDQNWPKYTV